MNNNNNNADDNNYEVYKKWFQTFAPKKYELYARWTFVRQRLRYIRKFISLIMLLMYAAVLSRGVV